MKYQKLRHRLLTGIMTAMLVLGAGTGISAVTVQAASGTVYSCTITPSYTHPVTGEIEDAGGQASYATGQGMVEGAVTSDGMMEVTDSGEYYLTFCMSLMDYTTNHSFAVQKTGDSGWSAVEATVTAQGSDNNGTTADIRVQVPGSDCILRISMYVSPMGRDVIFYAYPGNYTEGNNSGMTAAIVTEPSGTGAESDGSSAGENTGSGNSEGTGENGSSDSLNSSLGISAAGTTDNAETQENAGTTDNAGTQADTEASVNAGALEDTETANTDSSLTAAQGLSLSTAVNAAGEENTVSGEETDTGNELFTENSGGTASLSAGTLILVLTVSLTISGLIILGAGAGIVYYFRKNWDRWGGDDDED